MTIIAKRTRFVCASIVAMFAIVLVPPAQSQQLGPAPEGCVKDVFGKISCPPIGGEAYLTLSGQAVCGKGRCVRDLSGKVTCSSVAGGQVLQDASGRIACAGGCEEASPSYCRILQ
jgi:hypothetical protein